jgi:hypothetical protein
MGTAIRRWPDHQIEYRDGAGKRLIAMRRGIRPIRNRRDLPAETRYEVCLVEIDLLEAIIALNHAGAGIAVEDEEPCSSTEE